MQGEAVREVSGLAFDQEVVRGSAQRPVVVDFWAPWCGPCRALGPLLERLAAEADGAWTLAKVNVDDNQELSQRYGVQGIPAVKGFRDGQVVAEFVGAQPESAVRAFLRRLLPSEADLAAAEGDQRREAGDVAAAEEAYRLALTARPDHPRALLGLGQLLAEHGDPQEAQNLLAALPVATPEGREAAPILARLRFARHADGAEATPGAAEIDLIWAASTAAAARGDYAEALRGLLTIVERDRRYRNGAARPAMLDVFAILGPDSPLTQDYQRRLARALFS